MGGVGLAIEIKEAKLAEGKGRSTPRALHRAISTSILSKIWKRCRYGVFRQTAGNYLSEERGDGYLKNLWSASNEELAWGFMDHAGCCSGSSEACYHWFKVALNAYRVSLDSIAAKKGYEISAPRKANIGLLFSCAYPLFSAEKQAYCVTSFSLAKLDWEEDWNGPFWDEGSPRPKIADFSGKLLDAIKRCTITGLCECEICCELRREEEFTTGSELRKLEDAWIRISSDKKLIEAAGVIQADLMALPDSNKKHTRSGSLQELSKTLGEAAPEWWELAGICCRVVDRARRG